MVLNRYSILTKNFNHAKTFYNISQIYPMFRAVKKNINELIT